MLGLAIVVSVLGGLCSLAMLLLLVVIWRVVTDPRLRGAFKQHCPSCCPHRDDDCDAEDGTEDDDQADQELKKMLTELQVMADATTEKK